MQIFKNLLIIIATLLLSSIAQAASSMPKPGAEFKDCAECPVMVVMPRQSFWMGSPDTEMGRSANEGPLRRVDISYPLAIAKTEITFAEWDACVADGGCGGRRPADEGRGRGNLPVINVDWDDAQAYAKWMSAKTGKKYRMLSEAEWEFGARAGAATTYAWGDKASHSYANYGTDECCGGFVSGTDQWEISSPAGSFPANAFGLQDLSGNLWEWVEDCWDENPATGPVDGSARITPDCQLRIMKGGSWASMPVRIRPAFRDAYTPNDHGEFIGFRIARAD